MRSSSNSFAIASESSTSSTTIERSFGGFTIAASSVAQTLLLYTIGIYYLQSGDASIDKEQVMCEWQQLYQCALAVSNMPSDNDLVRVFLAMDNAVLKEYVCQEEPLVFVTGDPADLNMRRCYSPE
jgi:hypothetical protein